VSGFKARYDEYAAQVELELERLLPLPREDWPESSRPKALAQAMRYSLLSGGKRLRPVLLLAAYRTLREDLAPALPFAAAVEMIHAYSLIHDDLPAMDNDDLRRGQPTSHRAFGEATAILAGDALLNLAFETMLGSGLPRACQAARIIAEKAGAQGMIAGQMADILSEGRSPDPALVRYIHLRKTACLLTAPVMAGLTLSDAGQGMLEAGETYGRELGLAFQITDDLLDLSGTPEQTGKSGGRDAALGKMTWPAAVGFDKARADASAAVDKAVLAAEGFGHQAPFFRSLALSLLERVR